MNEGTARAERGQRQVHRVGARNSSSWSALQGAQRHARSAVSAADAGYRDCSCCGAEREAESQACKFTLASLPHELMPNPSLKRSANGSPPGPVRGAVAFSTARAWRPAVVARLARTLGLTPNSVTLVTTESSPPPNTWLKLSAAVIVGVFLYQVLVVVFNGYLAAVGVPRAYFAWFGRPRLEFALAVLQFALSVPVFLLLAGGVLATCRLFGSRTRAFLAALLVGMLLCLAYWTVSFVFVAKEQLPPGSEPYPVSKLFIQSLRVSWWGLPTALAPWLGFAFATWLLLRRPRREA